MKIIEHISVVSVNASLGASFCRKNWMAINTSGAKNIVFANTKKFLFLYQEHNTVAKKMSVPAPISKMSKILNWPSISVISDE